MTVFPHPIVASGYNWQSYGKRTFGPFAKGAILNGLWMLPRNISHLEFQHKSKGHQASTYAVKISNYLDQRS